MGVINKDGAQIYRYMNFDAIDEYAQVDQRRCGLNRNAGH